MKNFSIFILIFSFFTTLYAKYNKTNLDHYLDAQKKRYEYGEKIGKEKENLEKQKNSKNSQSSKKK